MFLWLGLVPAGLGLYVAYLALSSGDALMPFHAQDVWGRHFAGPYLGVWDGVEGGFEGARQLLSFQRHHVYFPIAAGSPDINAGHNLLLLAFLIAAVPAIVGVLRLLPLAYGVYVIAALALPLSYPVRTQPLMSLPRFLVVLFPLGIWLAAWLAGASPRTSARLADRPADGVLHGPVRNLALGCVADDDARRLAQSPHPPRPSLPGESSPTAPGVPVTDWPAWMAPAALVVGSCWRRQRGCWSIYPPLHSGST